MARAIDLDALRAARLEVIGDGVTVVFNGREFRLPPEMPIDVALELGAGNPKEAASAAFGDDFEAFWALRPSMEDLEALFTAWGQSTGVGDAGESEASGAPSNGSSAPSRPTSPATTG